MESVPTSFAVANAFGVISNAGHSRYLLEAESTTGFVAYRLANNTTIISGTQEMSLQESDQIIFWACAGANDPTAAGGIAYLDCHGNALLKADVSRLADLQFLDLSFNGLREINVSGLVNLEALDLDNNFLTVLSVRGLNNLRVLNCANNRIANLDVSGLGRLQICDYSGNPVRSVNTHGCVALQP